MKHVFLTAAAVCFATAILFALTVQKHAFSISTPDIILPETAVAASPAQPVDLQNATPTSTATSTPIVPSVQQDLAPKPPAELTPSAEPQLSIPEIQLSAMIANVATDPDGRMSVPTAPHTVGWYKHGTVPGQQGSAVLAAHVYLAFKNLHNLDIGSDIYVTTQEGKMLHFVVAEMKEYGYQEVPAQDLFLRSGAAWLNLITCSGKWLPKEKTYDHRLVVYASMVD